MIRIHDLTVPPLPAAERKTILEKKLRRACGGALPRWTVVRRSVDARKKDAIRYVYTVDLMLPDRKAEETLLKKLKGVRAERAETSLYRIPESGEERLSGPVMIVGAGPAGLFAALTLAEAGYSPLVIEQGAPVEEREKDVQAFWTSGKLDPFSNVQFGEGGAGTFSDGKLTTGIRDPEGRIGRVLRIFADCGADEEILFDAKPHIGTDVLKTVVGNMRERIRAAGGNFLFHTRLEDICAEDGVLKMLILRNVMTGESKSYPAGALILAPGHSARETFFMLQGCGMNMEAKAFAVGVRIEHPQKLIDRIQYGTEKPENLPPADYKLTAKTADGRSVYSFCMCPGGQVVNASSEQERLCVNGMSRHARNGRNANAALVVQVTPEDFAEQDVFAGLRFQREYEAAMWKLKEGKVPVQRWRDFAGRDMAEDRKADTEPVIPDICGAWEEADVASALPDFVRDALIEAMPQFDRRMSGYACPEALVEGFEGRTSSPVRLQRSAEGESNIRGIYPAGEGAGYAGGITSAAVDGIKAAEHIIRRFRKPEKE